jgi:quercetin dioxygenase-like cupin family protein
VVTLLRLAEVLDVDLKTLIDGSETASDVSLVRASEMQVFPVAGDTSGTARVLTHGRTEVEAFEFTADPGEWLGEHIEHGGSDFIYVTSGTLRVDLGAKGVHELGPGDALCHSGRVPHRWSVGSDEPVKFVCVVNPTTPGGVEHLAR